MASHRAPSSRVAVVIPTYQRRDLVVAAVESVLAQTFTDFELIVVDDGSTDGTRELLSGVDDRLRYVWQANAGVAAARNHGIALTRAPVVAFLDSDNRWLPDHLAVLSELLDRHPEAAMASTCPSFEVKGHELPADAVLIDVHERILTAGESAGYVSCVAMRRSAIDTVGGFDGRIHGGEDTDLLVRVATQGPLVAIRRATVVRRAGPGTLTDAARRAGGYLEGTERSAQNLIAVAERSSGPGSERLAREAEGMLHLSRAIQALARADAPAVRDELALAVPRVPGLGDDPEWFVDRVRRHLPDVHDRRALERALTIAAEQWPDATAPTARLTRTLAVATALRVGHPRSAARLVAGRPRGGNLRFMWQQRALLWELALLWREYRRRQAGA